MKGSQRKKEIITTAAKLFKEKGYSAVTMRDLANALGIKAASLYNHINSKQAILTEIIISIAKAFTAGMHDIEVSKVSSIEKLKQIIALHIAITYKNPYGMASLNNDWMHLETQLDYYLTLRKNYENNFRNIVLEGIKNNELVEVNPEILLFSMLSTLRTLHLWIPKKEDVTAAQLTLDLSHVLISGVQKL